MSLARLYIDTVTGPSESAHTADAAGGAPIDMSRPLPWWVRNIVGPEYSYRAEFVEPAPRFDVVTYRVKDGHKIARDIVIGRRRLLADALERAAAERRRDAERGCEQHFRTVVRAAR